MSHKFGDMFSRAFSDDLETFSSVTVILFASSVALSVSTKILSPGVPFVDVVGAAIETVLCGVTHIAAGASLLGSVFDGPLTASSLGSFVALTLNMF